MTGIVINNNEYDISTGSTKIEYSNTKNTVSYSMYGEEIPFTPIIKEFLFAEAGSHTVELEAGEYIICVIGGGSSGYCSGGVSSQTIKSGMSGGYLVVRGQLEAGTYNITVADYSASGTSMAQGTKGADGNPSYITDSNYNQIIWVTGGKYNSSVPTVATYSNNFTLIEKDLNNDRDIKSYSGSARQYGRGDTSITTGFFDYNSLYQYQLGYGGSASGVATGKSSSATYTWRSGGQGLVSLKKLN